ncbi:MAG: hemerythrin domain-containing protein [Dermatophilaceae bacterium]|jgi:hemerythrin-like domain-containing protein|uniref:Hemerythrin domain-containing protein n=1 Tax=Candidatus Phosphoribacter hodrii TaxID=2953743 RepID=A0A935ILK2_9MICO|nr:hemerythrin domain-containing protein [Candidatus Phosphoribacter hodrii]MBP9920213.1 hemerythrin domain-containing protein [Dermatophilaceae bacterium]
MCSYCGCESITTIGDFMAEHIEIVNATTALRLASASHDTAAAPPAAAVLAQMLTTHAHREEVGLFRVLARQEEFTSEVTTLCGEHGSLDAQLAAIVAGDLDAVNPLIDALRDHINREENGLFPASAIALSGSEWDEVERTTPPSAVHRA